MGFTEKQVKINKLSKEYQELIEEYNERELQLNAITHYMVNHFSIRYKDGFYTPVELKAQHRLDWRCSHLAENIMYNPRYAFEYFVKLSDTHEPDNTFYIALSNIDWELNNIDVDEYPLSEPTDFETTERLKKAQIHMQDRLFTTGFQGTPYRILSICLRYSNRKAVYTLQIDDDSEKNREPITAPLSAVYWRR